MQSFEKEILDYEENIAYRRFNFIFYFLLCSKADHDTKDLVNATAWMQNAGEYKALTIQAYQLAQIRLAQILTQEVSEKPRAIVLDIDETVLDNSPYQAYQIENKKTSTRKTGANGQDLLRQSLSPEL